MPATAEDMQTMLERIGTDDRRSAERLRELADESRRVRSLLVARGRAYVKMARAGLLPVGGGLEALVEHASQVERIRRALARDLERERALAEERVRLSKERKTFGERRAVLETEREALARSHTAILAAEEREAAFRRAFLGGHEAVSHTAVYGSGFGPLDPSELERGFAGQRGRLPLPLEGRVEVRPARLPSADGPGLELAARFGAPVRSVYPGRVAFADSYADYGQAVILDHGDGYYSVSGYLGTLEVHVGDEVGAGERLGTVGNGPKGPALYFELRHAGQTVPPAPWFGI
jgi:septal ring factor EnvC (AmiA/AmiB activator)